MDTRTNTSATAAVMEVDARGLEPPEPLVRILEAVTGLPPGGQLRALTDRCPVHLHTQLALRGFRGETQAIPGGGYVTHICRG